MNAEQAWRELCAAEYKSYIIGYGNDGDPRNDISPARHDERAADLAERLSQQVSIPPVELRGRASDAAYAHGQDPGTDHDPDRFAPPDWAEWGAQAQDDGWAR